MNGHGRRGGSRRVVEVSQPRGRGEGREDRRRLRLPGADRGTTPEVARRPSGTGTTEEGSVTPDGTSREQGESSPLSRFLISGKSSSPGDPHAIQ